MAHIGNSETSTVYAAELQGINLAFQIVDNDVEKGNKRDRVVIFMDNQVAIRTFQTPTGRSGVYIVAEAILLIDKLQRAQRTLVKIRWVLAYTGIWGNEAADRAAKTVARQHLGASPGTLNVTQPKTYYSQTTLKTWIMRQTKAEWRNN
jgi:ribonuclease HI